MSEIVTDDGTKIAYSAWGRRDGLAGPDDPGTRRRRPRMGAAARCVRPETSLHRDRQPRHRPLRCAARPVRPRPHGRGRARRCSTTQGIERAHIVGASMGGVIAQILGVLHPERTRSLTFACTACRHHEWRRELLAEWVERGEREGHGRPGRRRHALADRAASSAPLRCVRERAGACPRPDEARSVRRAGRRDPRRVRRAALRAAKISASRRS